MLAQRKLCRSLPGLHVHQVQQLFIHGFGTAWRCIAYGFRSAVTQMILQQGAADGAQRFLHGRNLYENVGAVAIFFHEALQSAHLTFDAAQPL